MMANCIFDALPMSNCLLVNEGKSALLTLAKILKIDFFITRLIVNQM